MTMGRMGRWMAGGLLATALLAAAGCSDQRPPSHERSIEENLSDTREIVPPPTPLPVSPPPAAPPTAVQAETLQAPPPAEPPSAEAQMQDDAAASGMTSQLPETNGDTEPVSHD